MKFRYARHTKDLKRIERFYTEIVGLEKLGSFENHDNYDGIFLGLPNVSWHLEFTVSDDLPESKFDADDILVFYMSSEVELNQIRKIINKKNISVEVPKNPYWIKNGVMISDPDGYKVLFAIKHLEFTSDDDLTKLIDEKSIKNWNELLDFVQSIPYGRNLNREDFSLVLKENKGTCSSKHGFLKKVADLNHFDDVKLVLGMYKMNHLNTPKIGNTLMENGLEYVPEAHCYLKINNLRIDITAPNSDFELISNYIMEEIEIEAEQVNTYKVEFHKKFIQKWIDKNKIRFNLEEIWTIRELCIKKLEDNN